MTDKEKRASKRIEKEIQRTKDVKRKKEEQKEERNTRRTCKKVHRHHINKGKENEKELKMHYEENLRKR